MNKQINLPLPIAASFIHSMRIPSSIRICRVFPQDRRKGKKLLDQYQTTVTYAVHLK